MAGNKHVERKGIIIFNFHSELDIRGDVIKMGMKGRSTIFPNDKSVVNKPKPEVGFEMPIIKSYGLKVFHKDVKLSEKGALQTKIIILKNEFYKYIFFFYFQLFMIN